MRFLYLCLCVKVASFDIKDLVVWLAREARRCSLTAGLGNELASQLTLRPRCDALREAEVTQPKFRLADFQAL